MGWIKQKKNEHVCRRPPLNGIIQPDLGDIWECDDCKVHWTVCDSQGDGLYWVSLPSARTAFDRVFD